MKKQLYTAVMAASMLFTAVPVSLYNNSIIVCSAEEKNFKIGDIITDNGLSFEVKGEQYFSDKTDADGNFIEEMTDSGYYWLSVAGYSGNEQEITIPKTLSGLDITSINVDAFRDNKIIRKVNIPETIREIGAGAFRGSSLTHVNIPAAVRVLPSYLFYGCKSLEEVKFDGKICLISNTAYENSALSVPEDFLKIQAASYIESSAKFIPESEDWAVTVPAGQDDFYTVIWAYIGSSEKAVIPDYVDGVRVGRTMIAWSNYPQVRSVTYPDIEFMAYEIEGSNIEELNIPYVTDMSKLVFKGNKVLKKVTVADNIESPSYVNSAFQNCTSLEAIPLPKKYDSVSVGDFALSGTAISEVDINKPSTIGRSAFSGCNALTDVKLTSAAVDSRAFSSCNALKEISFKGGTTLGELSIYNCPELENINIAGADITSEDSFDKCPKLTKIDSKPVFDSSTGDFVPEYKDFVFKYFSSADEVGFINQYVEAQAEKVVSQVVSDDMTDIEKAKAIHDWLCKNTTYDPGPMNSRKNHSDASVFMNDNTVCEGYARIYNIMLHKAGVESCYVVSDDHAWDIVKLGGHYFHIDVTWDDRNSNEISYDWFMKSDAEMQKAGGSHAKWKTDIPSSLHEFQKTALPECGFSMGDMNTDGEVNVADLVKMSRYILGNDTIKQEDSVLSDLDFSGRTDVFDMVKLRKKLIKNA